MTHPDDIHHVTVDGQSMSLQHFVAVARFEAKVDIAPAALERMRLSRATVDTLLRDRTPAYGINTGFGDLCSIAIPETQACLLQNNLILSHCTGTGDPLPDEAVRGMLLLRINALCAGLSGIRPELVKTMAEMLNAGVTPIVPEKGSLGASGDLAPLSHMALVLTGRGEARVQGERLAGALAMGRAGLPTYSLLAKEGLALINGTQAMCSVGALALHDALCAAQLADVVGSMSMEALCGVMDAFDERVHAARPHPHQALVAANFRGLNEGSALLKRSRGLRVQDAYVLRCIPQVHGAVRAALDHVRCVVETEMNSVTDNPLIFPEDGAVLSGGNFHGEPLALAFDYLGIAASEIASISERRLERMVNAQLSGGLPAFLVRNGGVNSGFMIVQYAAASMVSENKVYAHPASVDSIPSSANQEDHVSMGMTAARKARMIVDNTLSVLALELFAAAQAVELRAEAPSPVHQAVFEMVRREVPFYAEDREMRLDIERMNRLIRDGCILKLVHEAVPSFK